MTEDAPPSDTHEVEPLPLWIAKTLGYVILTVFATIVLVNAVMSFFFETTNAGIGGGVGAAIGAAIAVRRRHLIASKK